MRSKLVRIYSVACASAALLAGFGASRASADAQALPGSAWTAGAARQIALREYHASSNEVGIQAPNRRHNLRIYFESTGVRVHDRTAPGEPRLFGLALVGLGRGKALEAVAPGRVVSEGARVEIRRPGLVEWYLNSPEGLEQGFTLARRPEGEGPLVLDLALAGSQATLAGTQLRIRTDTGRWLAYGALAAFDAEGHAHPARFESSATDHIALVVDDRGARYPLVIDPLLTATADAQLESNQASTLFGGSVAGAGDVNGDGYADVIVGAEEYDSGQINEGAAFLFLGSAAGIASAGPATPGVTQLESNQSGALFGTNVAGAGDVNGDGYADVIVGAQEYDFPEINEGAAFLFLGSAAGIASGNPGTAASRFESNQAGALFGGAVAGAGDVNGDGYADVVVGGEEYNVTFSNDGGAWIFLGSAAGIANANPATAATQIASNQLGALLGGRVAGAGDVNSDGYADVIVGAEAYDNGQTDEGAAWIFLGSAIGIPSGLVSTAATQLESNQAGALFAGPVAGAGDVNGDGYSDVIVGAEFYDNGESNEGAAWIFLGSGAGIPSGNVSSAATQLESNQASSSFGGSAAGAGDVNGDGIADVIVGAPMYDNPTFNEGAAFVFLGSATGIADGNPTTAFAQLESNQSGATMGSVARAGDVNGDGYADVIVGADAYDNGHADEGVAWIYLGGATGIANGTPSSASATLESDQSGASMGGVVAGAGDVNGDGYSDAIVGAAGFDAGQADEGAAFLFLGSATGIASAAPGTAAAQLESNQVGALLGSGVAGAGDVNGDGYADVIVGAEAYDNGQTDEGAAFLFLGAASGIANGNPSTAATRLESDQAGALLGGSVAGAGDTNRDGYADLIVGSDRYDNGQTDEGAAFVFLGAASGIANGTPASASARLESDQTDALLGASVAGAGDTNGDGYAEVIVGADRYDNGQADEGAAFVFLGAASGIANGTPATAAATLESNQANATLGVSVSAAGDVNRDGYADLIVGAEAYDNGQADEGAAFLFLGSALGIASANPSTPGVSRLESDQANAFLGGSVASAGDVNGDGYADAIVGADRYDNGQSDEGAAFLFLGGASGIANGTPASASARLESDQADARLGASVVGAGDVNGDGFADVIAGSDLYDNAQGDEGAAFVFLGNRGVTGRSVRSEQRRGDGSTTPVQPRGRSHASGSFEVALTATHPDGRGRVKLEVDTCPLAAPFGDVSCTTQVAASWTDVTASAGGVRLVEQLSGLPDDTPHRWRARVLHAPFRVTQPGITSPPKPAHGPWRRVDAQAIETNILLPEPSEIVLLLSALACLLAVGRRRIVDHG